MANINDSQCVLVIGATAGIGRSLALSILSLPSKPTVVVSGRRQDRLDELTRDHKHDGRLEGIQMDINTDRATLKKTVEAVVTKYPKVTLVCYSFRSLRVQPPPAGYNHLLCGCSVPI